MGIRLCGWSGGALFIAVVVGIGMGCASSPRPRGLTIWPKETAVDSRVEVPMHLTSSGLPQIDATVGTTPTKCIIDTGASVAMIDPALAVSEHFSIAPRRALMIDAGGNKVRDEVCLIPRCDIGGATFFDFVGVAQDLWLIDGVILSHAGSKFVLSPALFRDVLVTLDYPNHQLIIEEGSLPPPDGQEILPMRITAHGHLLVPVKTGDQEEWLLLDTGCTAGLVIPDAHMKEFPGTGNAIFSGEVNFYSGKGDYQVARLSKDLHLGRHVITTPLFMTGSGAYPTLGSQYIQKFAVTIDQKNRRVRFARRDRGAIATPSPVLLAMHWKKETGVITAVREGGSAQKGGVKLGDRIIDIEGVTYADWLQGKRFETLRRPGYLTFWMVHPDGKEFRVEVEVREMLAEQKGG